MVYAMGAFISTVLNHSQYAIFEEKA